VAIFCLFSLPFALAVMIQFDFTLGLELLAVLAIAVLAESGALLLYRMGFQSEQVADLLLTTGDHARGEKRAVTILFSDLRGFTGLSENRDPAQVVSLLKTYFEAMCAVVDRHGGIVNKFLGDGLMALFGAPLESADATLQAARAALSMVGEVERLRQECGLPELDLRIGIHTGEAVLGLIGSRERSEYTAIGDVVNLASRLEGLNKEFGTRILVSDTVQHALSGVARFRALGEARVKGREKPVAVAELVAIDEVAAAAGGGPVRAG
jgi:adenylate cyclase